MNKNNEWLKFLNGEDVDAPLAVKKVKKKPPLRVSKRQLRSIRNGKDISSN